MRLALCSLVLCSSTVALAQSQPQSQLQSQRSRIPDRVPAFIAPTTVILIRPYGMNCPVGMNAERQASGQREWVVSLEDALRPQRPDTRANKAVVHVELLGVKEMKQARVSVDYTGPGVRLMPASQYWGTAAPPFDLTKTFVLSAEHGGALDIAKSLLVGNAASITRVRLLSIEYSDGSIWQAKSANNCSVEPGLLMAVASR